MARIDNDNYHNNYNQYNEYIGFNSGFISGFENKNALNGHKYTNVIAKTSKLDKLNDTLLQDNKVRFRLESQEEEFIYKPDEHQFTFYQICQFSIDKKYNIRKLFYNEYGNLVKNKESYMKKDKLNKFIKKCPKYKYTIYPAYNLDVVGYPEDNEILTAQSHILNNY